MIAAPLAPDEAARLAELKALDILDTPPEQRFDRIVDVAARVFHVPIAYVALVDANRQWFKARCGLDSPETSRSVSFCAHTILQDGPLVIPDALEDERFRDSPLVVGEPHIRFYAGHPLAGPGGRNVGTLCLADRSPRTLDEGGVEILARLAAMTEHELGMMDLIRTQRELLETKSRLLESQQRLARELAEAGAYVKSLLPEPMEGRLRTDWQFVASSELGGDFFGYRWLDEGRLAIYLLDVMGHGVGAALLSTSVETALRGRTLPGVAFDDPAAVVTALNGAFPMDQNGGRFFSLWYGVYDTRDRSLTYANAGHPPALLFGSGAVWRLGATGLIAGIMPEAEFAAQRVSVPRGSRLYLFSDGAFEVPMPEGGMLLVDGLEAVIARAASRSGARTAEVLRMIRAVQAREEFADDFSLLEIEFE
jgi:phosphoserine phosphatase RsbU/P